MSILGPTSIHVFLFQIETKQFIAKTRFVQFKRSSEYCGKKKKQPTFRMSLWSKIITNSTQQNKTKSIKLISGFRLFTDFKDLSFL